MKNLQDEQDRSEIIRRLRSVKPDTPRRWGTMTANQMICHLSDAFRGATGELKIAATGTFFQSIVVKRLMLNLPVRVKNFPTPPEIDQEIGGTRPTDFLSDLAKLERLIAKFSGEGSDFTQWSHPFFGQMSRRQWSRWAFVHIHHHLRQFGA